MHELQPEIWTLMGISILAGISDFRSRHVPAFVFAAGTAAGVFFCVTGKREAAAVLPALAPGIVLTVFSFCSGGGIGIGDGLYFIMAGFFLIWRETLLLLTVSSLFAAAAALAFILYGSLKGKNMRKKSLPFLSFTPFALLVIRFL